VKKRPDKRPAPEQISLLPPDAATFLHLVRENLRLLREFGIRYEVSWLTAAGTGQERVIRSPRDVAEYFQAELSVLAQEQLRVVLLNAKNYVIGVSLIYQGGLSCANVLSLSDWLPRGSPRRRGLDHSPSQSRVCGRVARRVQVAYIR
jgi:hypothetical protein